MVMSRVGNDADAKALKHRDFRRSLTRGTQDAQRDNAVYYDCM